MLQLLEYYGRYQGFRGRFAQLPSWARVLLGFAALPGIILIALSIMAFLVSLLALLLLTVPLYRLLTAMFGVKPGVVMPAGTSGFGPVPEGMEVVVDQAGESTVVESTVVESRVEEPQRSRRQIEVKIVE